MDPRPRGDDRKKDVRAGCRWPKIMIRAGVGQKSFSPPSGHPLALSFAVLDCAMAVEEGINFGPALTRITVPSLALNAPRSRPASWARMVSLIERGTIAQIGRASCRERVGQKV